MIIKSKMKKEKSKRGKTTENHARHGGTEDTEGKQKKNNRTQMDAEKWDFQDKD